MKIRNVHFITKMPVATALCGVVLLGGCMTAPQAEPPPPPAILKAAYTPTPVKIDGVLDDEVWSSAQPYQLSLGQDEIDTDKVLAEPGEVQLAWGDTHFYVAVTFHDSDIVAEGEEDQLHHYSMGDLVELFLKPEGEGYTWYWELYATPKSKKTSFWFPGRGRLGLKSCYEYECGLQVAAQNSGTVGDWEDKDNYWTAEMAMPIKDLTARGETFGPGSAWRILIARYNYSRYLPWKELSMCPPLSKTSYHLTEEYGVLELVK
jgi:hypothetical protein